MNNNYLDIAPEVKQALSENRPVVALESTIISHGMPYPQNVETALLVEAEVQKHGAQPATIAIMDGRLKVGLSKLEIDTLGQAGHAVTKVSRRDLPFVLAKKEKGATTVAATMIIAAMAGIPIFATGGIGGVHRGASETFDVSADLQELAQTDVAVVSAGMKSILDLGLTLEYLETHGVPVIGYQTETLPAFFSRESRHRVDYKLDTPGEIAAVMAVRQKLGMQGGMVIANPIPAKYGLNPKEIDYAIDQAVEEAQLQGIRGKETTPFLLSRIVEITGGLSLEANIGLVLNNARLAAQIAQELANGNE